MPTGIKYAINVANLGLQTQAYQKFSLLNGYKNKTVTDAKDFYKLPISDKKNYIHKLRSREAFEKGIWPDTAYASSGSSGNPTFWFRSKQLDEVGGKLHEKIFRQIFGIKKTDETLVIICFSMGIWIAGNYTLSCCHWVSSKGYKLTSISPGIEKHDIFHILKNLAPNFKNIILAGYPSFIMDVLAESKQKKINLPKNLFILTSGDSFSEQWRDAALKFFKKPRPEYIISIYGSADAGVIGFETPLSIFVRRAAQTNRELYERVFGNDKKQPALSQYNDGQNFIEQINNELVITANTTMPLIRYNIHDVGNIINYEEVSKILLKHKLFEAAKLHGLRQWKAPFIIKKGRTDVAVTYYALNIYPEHIQTGLNDKKIINTVSGNFRAYNQTVKNHSKEELHLEVELSEKHEPSKKLLTKISGAIVENLLKINTEFRKLHSTIGEKAMPKIKLVKKINGEKVNNYKTLFSIKGKKTKML